MIAPFELHAPRILFGSGVFHRLPEVLGGARRLLVVTGKRREVFHRLRALLPDAELHAWTVGGEPTIEDAREGAQRASAAMAEAVVAVGGGSVLDAAKAAAALAPNSQDVMEYLEVIGRGRPLEVDALPVVAIPTTAGTGSEVTRNAVLGSATHGVKASLRSPRMLPRVALVDPDLLDGCPRSVLAASGLDALTQLIEPFLSPAANPATDALIRSALPGGLRALPRLLADPADAEARQEMAWASLCSGLALSNAKLGLVHGIAGPLGGRRPIPHGVVCARLLPEVLAFNLSRMSGERPAALCELLTGGTSTRAQDAVAALRELARQAGIPGLSEAGLREEDLEPVAGQSLKSGSTRGNPVPVTHDDVLQVLRASLPPL